MAREDLLDQGGARARQAHDEDRGRARRAVTLPLLEELARVDAARAQQAARGLLGPIRHELEPDPVALGVVPERALVLGLVLERLAERELEVAALLAVDLAAQRGAHRRDLVGGEAEGLEVREAPPGLAVARVERDRAAVGLDRARLVAGRAERVAEAEPDLRVARILLEQGFVERDRGFVVAHAAEHHRLEVPAERIVGIRPQQRLDLGQGLGRLVRPLQHLRIVLARFAEARRELDATREQGLRILVASEARGQLPQHAQRHDVGRRALEVLAQALLGLRQAIGRERVGRGEQLRVSHGVPDVRRVRGVGAGLVADRTEVVGQQQPGLGQRGLERERAAERRDRLVAPSRERQGTRALVVRQGPAGVGRE